MRKLCHLSLLFRHFWDQALYLWPKQLDLQVIISCCFVFHSVPFIVCFSSLNALNTLYDDNQELEKTCKFRYLTLSRRRPGAAGSLATTCLLELSISRYLQELNTQRDIIQQSCKDVCKLDVLKYDTNSIQVIVKGYILHFKLDNDVLALGGQSGSEDMVSSSDASRLGSFNGLDSMHLDKKNGRKY